MKCTVIFYFWSYSNLYQSLHNVQKEDLCRLVEHDFYNPDATPVVHPAAV